MAQAYRLLGEMAPQLAEWQAAGKVAAILNIDGETPQPVSLGGYRIKLNKAHEAGFPVAIRAQAGSRVPGNVASASRAMPNDMRPFALVVNTAPDEFFFIGSNGDPGFTVDSPGLPHVAFPLETKAGMKREGG